MSHWKLLEIHHPTRDASAPACDACGEHHDLHYLAIDQDGDQYNLGGACAVACGVVDSVVHDELSEAAEHHHGLPDGWDKELAGDDLHAMVREFQPVGHGFDEPSDEPAKYARRKSMVGQKSIEWDESEHPRSDDGKFADKSGGQAVASVGEAVKSGAKRTRKTVHFDRPIVGPSGASLHSYDWKWMWEEGPEHDDPVRVSDWNEAELNEHTGRHVVHQFSVADADGNNHLVSLETAIKMMGFGDDSAGIGKVKNLASAAMQLAEHEQAHERLLATPEGERKNGHAYTVSNSQEKLGKLKERVENLTKEAARAASGKSPNEHYRDVAKKILAIKQLFHFRPGNTRNNWQGAEIGEIAKAAAKSYDERKPIEDEGRRVFRELAIALRANVLGETTPKTPIPEEIPERLSFGTKVKAVPAWSDSKMRNWYFDRGEQAEEALEQARGWLKKYHPDYNELIQKWPAFAILNDEPAKYARRKQLASTAGQRSLFQESGSDGKHVIWKEHLHPRDEGGQFAKKGQDRIPSTPGQKELVEGPEGSGFVPPVRPPSTSKKHQPRLANFDQLFLDAWHGGAGKSDADFLAELKAERASRVEEPKAEQPAGKEPWQLTYGDLRNALNPSTREELQAARPLLAAMYPPDDDRITATEGDDPWGIHRAITKGDETPRVPMHDLSFRHKAAIRKAIAEGENVPAEVLADYDEFKQRKNVQTGRLLEAEPQGSVSGDDSEPARPVQDPNPTPAGVGGQSAPEFSLERGKVKEGRPDPVPDDTKERQGLLMEEINDLPGQKRFFGGEEERARAAGHPKPGDKFTMPASHTTGEFEAELVDAGDGRVGIKRAGTDSGALGSITKVKAEQLPQFLDDLRGKLSGKPNSPNESVNAAIRGDAKLLGRGNDGLAFDAGDGNVVKAASDVPFHWNNGLREQGEGGRSARAAVELNEKLRAAGIPGLLPQQVVEHEGRVYTVMPRLDTESPLTQEHIDQLKATMNALHESGHTIGDDLQAGIGQDGKAYVYDTGAIRKQNSKFDVEDDGDRLARLAEKHGREFKRLNPHLDYHNAMESALKKLGGDKPPSSPAAKMLADKLEEAWANLDADTREFYEDEHKETLAKLRPEAAAASSDPWENTPRKLFGTGPDRKEKAEAAGWKFETDDQGYNGNPPAYYAISPEGQRYVWENNMRHGGADPWKPVGKPEGAASQPSLTAEERANLPEHLRDVNPAFESEAAKLKGMAAKGKTFNEWKAEQQPSQSSEATRQGDYAGAAPAAADDSEWIKDGKPMPGAPLEVRNRWELAENQRKLSESEGRQKKLQASLEDWKSRVYKQNNSTINKRDQFGQDGGDTTIGAANERRKAATIRSLQSQIEDEIAAQSNHKKRIAALSGSPGVDAAHDAAMKEAAEDTGGYLDFLLGKTDEPAATPAAAKPERKFMSAGEAAKAGKSYADWTGDASGAYVAGEIDDEHPSWKAVQHGAGPSTSEFNAARDIYGQHVRFYNYGSNRREYGRVTDVSDDAKTVTVTRADGSTYKTSPGDLDHLGAAIQYKDQRGQDSAEAVAYLAPILAKEFVESGENISVTMKKHRLDPIKSSGARNAIIAEADKLREAAKPQPSEARQRAMDKQRAREGGKLTREQFEAEYRKAFAQANKYGPNAIGGAEATERMAKLADEYPEWAEEVEAAPEPKAEPDKSRKWTKNEDGTYTDSAGTIWKKAAAGGEISPVTGERFAGGALMPIHGLHKKPDAKPTKGKGVASSPAKPNENKDRRAIQPLTAEQRAERLEREEREKKWGTVRDGHVGKLLGLGDRPHSLRRTDGGTKNWEKMVEEAGLTADQVKQLADHFQEKAVADVRKKLSDNPHLLTHFDGRTMTADESVQSYLDNDKFLREGGAAYWRKKWLKSHPELPRAQSFVSDYLSGGPQGERLHDVHQAIEALKRGESLGGGAAQSAGYQYGDTFAQVTADNADTHRDRAAGWVHSVAEGIYAAKTGTLTTANTPERLRRTLDNIDEINRALKAAGQEPHPYSRESLEKSIQKLESGIGGGPKMAAYVPPTRGEQFSGILPGASAQSAPGKPYVEPTADELGGEAALAAEPYTLATAEKHYEAMRSGKATAAQAKEWFDQWDKSRDSLKAELSKKTVAELKKMGAGGFHAAGMKKDELVNSAVDMIGEQYNVTGSLRWSPFSEKKNDALRRAVGGQTDEHFKEFAEKVAKAMDERKEKIAGYVKAMKEPETLEEFREHVRVNGIGKLSDEQLAKYDDMVAVDRRAREAAGKSTVTGFRPGAQATGDVGIVEGHHQKRNTPTWTVTVAEHLGDNWSEALSRAKSLGGSYVNARIAKAYGATPGFQFFSKEAAEQMQEVLGGKSVDRSGALAESKLASIENAADRLAALAASTHESADAALNADRKTNTHKRAEQAAYAESRARSQEALAETMERLSGAMKEGKAKHLEGIRNRSHVEELNWQLRRARDAKLKAENAHQKPYDEYEALRDAPASEDDVKHAAYPYPQIWASQLQKHAEAFAEEPGLMRLAQRLQKTAAGAGPQFKKQGGGMKFSGGQILFPKETTQLQNLHVPEGKGIRVHQSHDWRLAEKSQKRGPFYTADGGKSFGTSPEIAVSAALSRGNDIDLVDRPEDKLLTISDSSEIATLSAAVKKLRRSSNRDLKRVGEELHSRLESYNRMQSMDIKNSVELRAAMRDYLPLRTKPQGEDKIKKLERGLAGKKIEGFFPTPRPLIERMIDAAGIEPGHEVLEPSAGKGDILDAIRERHPDANTAGIEPHSELRGIIEAKGHSLVDRDFTQHAGQYDRIVMNPPFERGQDAEHVQHAYERLKPGGRLVAITSAGPFQRSDKKSEAFRQWLDTVGGTYEDLPEGSFAGSDAFRQTGVNTKLVIVDKPE